MSVGLSSTLAFAIGAFRGIGNLQIPGTDPQIGGALGNGAGLAAWGASALQWHLLATKFAHWPWHGGQAIVAAVSVVKVVFKIIVSRHL